MNSNPKKCNICQCFYKPSASLLFSGVCSKCSDTEPENNYLYDEETEFEIYMATNIGGRVPAVFDTDSDSFGY